MLFTDASDAPQHLGGEESALYDSLKWAQAVTKALEHGLTDTIKDLRAHQRAIASLPSSGVPGELKQDCADDLERLAGLLDQEGFYQHTADLSTILTALHGKVATAAVGMAQAQQERIRDGEQDLKRIPEWAELTQETQNNALDQLAGLALVGHQRPGRSPAAPQPRLRPVHPTRRAEAAHHPRGAGAAAAARGGAEEEGCPGWRQGEGHPQSPGAGDARRRRQSSTS